MATSEKTAGVKLTLNTGSFLSGLKEVGTQVVGAGKAFGKALEGPTIAGLKNVKRAASDMAGALKGSLRLVAGIGGAVSLEESVRGALNLRGQFKALAFDVKAGTGEIVKWESLMAAAQAQGMKWGIATEQLGDAFKEVNEEVGDAAFAKDAMEAIAVTSRGTKASVESLAMVAGKMNERFGVTATELPDALATAYSLSKQGGLHFDEMAQAIDRVGSSAKLAGIQGVDGFARLIGMANLAKGDAKNVRGALAGVMAIVEDMAKPEFGKKMAQQFGIAVKDSKGAAKDFTKVIGEMLVKTGGKKELLAKGFEGEQLKIVNELGGVFRETFETTAGSVKQKTAAALAAYQGHLEAASRSQLNAAQVAEKAQENMSSPAAQMAVAMEEMKKAFTSPEMLDGLVRLSKMAPAAAQRMAKLLEMVFESPKTSMAIFAGIKLGVPFLQGALAAGAKGIGKALLESAPGMARSMAGSFTPTGSAPGALAKGAGALSAVASVAAAGAIGFAIGESIAAAIDKHSVNPNLETTHSLQETTMTADINTTGRFDTGAAEASLAELRKNLDKAKKDKEFQASDVYTLGLRRLGTASDDDIKKGEETLRAGEENLRAAKQAKDGFNMVADAAVAASKVLKTIGDASGAPTPGGGSASRGPIRPAPVQPGYAPR